MGRAPCCSKDAGLNRGAWTAEEDSILTQHILIHGDGGWKYLPQKAGLNRCGKSCRLRWLNYLRPDIKRGNISADEEELIIRMHKLLGNRWSLIAGRLPGRTDNEIKNYWNTKLVRKLENTESPEITKEFCKNLRSPSADAENQHVFRTVAVRTTAPRRPNNPSKPCTNSTSNQYDEVKLKNDMGSKHVDDSEQWCQSFAAELIKGTDFDHDSMESDGSSEELNGQHCQTMIGINVVSDCKSESYLREMSYPEDNHDDFSKPNGRKEEISSHDHTITHQTHSVELLEEEIGSHDHTVTHQTHNVELLEEQGMIELFDDIVTDDWIVELQNLRMPGLFQEEEMWAEGSGFPNCI